MYAFPRGAPFPTTSVIQMIQTREAYGSQTQERSHPLGFSGDVVPGRGVASDTTGSFCAAGGDQGVPYFSKRSTRDHVSGGFVPGRARTAAPKAPSAPPEEATRECHTSANDHR